MSASVADISWAVLRRIVQQWKGTSAEPAELVPLDGGCINTTVKVTTTAGDRAVLKISQHRVDRTYAREAYQLALLRDLGLPVPDVYDVHSGSLEEPSSYILMEWIEGQDLALARKSCEPASFDALQEEFAEILRKLHARHGSGFGSVESDTAADHNADNNTAGNGDGSPQGLVGSWPQCFAAMFDPIIREALPLPILSAKPRKLIEKLHGRLDRFLPGECEPSLTHWDLWSSNVLVSGNGDGRMHVRALLDPMCTWADPQAELAYLELFHTVTPAFMKAYQGESHLGDGYHRVCKPIYQLYALLNYAVIHGMTGGEGMHLLQERLDQVGALM
jgi:fructosamine-3-kinase